jgi:O-antigen/teichoic acid export membrane protein
MSLASLLRRATTGRFSAGLAWTFAGTAISQALAMVAAIVTARLLGRGGYGEYGMVAGTLQNAGILAGLGLGLTATKFVAELKSSDPARASRLLALTVRVSTVAGLASALAVFAAADVVAARALNAPQLADVLRLGAPVLLVGALAGAQNGALAGLEAFATASRVNVFRGAFGCVTAIVGVMLFGLPGAVGALVVGGALSCVVGAVALARARRDAGLPPASGPAELGVLWRFTLPAFLANALVGPATWVAGAILVRQSDGYPELGLVNAVNQWRTALLFLPGVMAQVALPLLASSLQEGEGQLRFDRLVRHTQGLTLLAVFPLTVGLMLLAGPLLALYGGDFSGGEAVVFASLACVLVQGVSSALGPAVQAKGRMWLGFSLNLAWAAVLIGTTSLLSPRLGGLALALGTGLGYVPITAWVLWWLRRELPTGFVPRALAALAFAILAPLACWSIPAGVRAFAAIPAMAFTLVAVVFVFSGADFRAALLARLFPAPPEIRPHAPDAGPGRLPT